MESRISYPGVKHPAEIAAFAEKAFAFVIQIARFTEVEDIEVARARYGGLHPLELLIPNLAEITVTAIGHCDNDVEEVLMALEHMFLEIFQDVRLGKRTFVFVADKVRELRRKQAENPPYQREALTIKLHSGLIQYDAALAYQKKAKMLPPEELRSYSAYTPEDAERIRSEIIESLVQIGEAEGFNVMESLLMAMLRELGANPRGVIRAIEITNTSLELFAARVCHEARDRSTRRKLGM